MVFLRLLAGGGITCFYLPCRVEPVLLGGMCVAHHYLNSAVPKQSRERHDVYASFSRARRIAVTVAVKVQLCVPARVRVRTTGFVVFGLSVKTLFTVFDDIQNSFRARTIAIDSISFLTYRGADFLEKRFACELPKCLNS